MQEFKSVIISLFFSALLSFSTEAQTVMPFSDFNGYFKTLNGTTFNTIDHLRVKEYQVGDEMVGYIDGRGNLMVYNGIKAQMLTNLEAKFEVSDHLIVWRVGATLNLWDQGKLQTLTYNAGDYQISDSLVVFEDLRYNCVKVYSRGTITTLYTVIDELYMPQLIGDNTVAFKDNGNIYKFFWNNEIYQVGPWNGAINISCGTDIITLNDPTTRTFTVFNKGEFIDIEQNFVGKYKAGRNFVVYEDLSGNLIRIQNGEKTELSNFQANFWEVKDDLIIWGENTQFFVYKNGMKHKITNYIPDDYKIKNNTIVFRNSMGGVSVFDKGKVVDLSNQMNTTYDIYGNSVIVNLFNNSFLFYQNGEILKY